MEQDWCDYTNMVLVPVPADGLCRIHAVFVGKGLSLDNSTAEALMKEAVEAVQEA